MRLEFIPFLCGQRIFFHFFKQNLLPCFHDYFPVRSKMVGEGRFELQTCDPKSHVLPDYTTSPVISLFQFWGLVLVPCFYCLPGNYTRSCINPINYLYVSIHIYCYPGKINHQMQMDHLHPGLFQLSCLHLYLPLTFSTALYHGISSSSFSIFRCFQG